MMTPQPLARGLLLACVSRGRSVLRRRWMVNRFWRMRGPYQCGGLRRDSFSRSTGGTFIEPSNTSKWFSIAIASERVMWVYPGSRAHLYHPFLPDNISLRRNSESQTPHPRKLRLRSGRNHRTSRTCLVVHLMFLVPTGSRVVLWCMVCTTLWKTSSMHC